MGSLWWRHNTVQRVGVARMALLAGLLSVSVIGCHAAEEPIPTPPGPAPAVEAPAPTLRRLTERQYRNSVWDLLGIELLTGGLEPDTAIDGLLSVGAAQTSLSPLGVEQYEAAAFRLAEQALDAAHRDRIVPCAPSGVVDAACAGQALDALGARAWRRPLSEEELAGLVALSGTAATVMGDFYQGLAYGVAMVLQSPFFLYRVELGEDDPDDPGQRRYTAHELATRLSYFLWDTTPDDALLAAAADGSLLDGGLEAQADRLLDDPRARAGVRSLFNEMLSLYLLDTLSQDPAIFVHMGPDVGASAREETLLGIERLVFDEGGDFRDILTTRETFLDRKLAAIYGVQAPARDGFGLTTLPESGGRRGLLGQVSFLAINAHPVSTSVTRRGRFIRQVLLCEPVDPPAASVNTTIPEPSEEARTMRERIAVHLTDPSCAGCHEQTDPLGLGLENFDGLGSWRTTENGATIDPSGDLDGAAFGDAGGLAGVLHGDARFTRCLSRTVYAYAAGHGVTEGEEALLGWLEDGFVAEDHALKALLRAVALSPGFRTVGALELE